MINLKFCNTQALVSNKSSERAKIKEGQLKAAGGNEFKKGK
jgi:hypothetical protein